MSTDMDGVQAPVDYDQFKSETGIELGNGTLRDFCNGTIARWPDSTLVQVLAVHNNKTMSVSDGATTAVVSFKSRTNNQVSPGSVVELIGLRVMGNILSMNEVTIILDSYANDVPTLRTDSMDEARPTVTKMDVAADDGARRMLPAAFVAHMDSRKRPADSDAGAPDKAATVEPVTKPAVRNPITQCTLKAISNIVADNDGFVIGPVVILRLVEGGPNARGKNSPSKLLVADADNSRIWYTTWSSPAEFTREFQDYKNRCFFLARGVAKEAWSKTDHVCEVDFQLDDGSKHSKSDNKLLVKREGTPEELRWVLQQLRAADAAVPWDTVARDDPRNSMSVIDAIDAQLGVKTYTAVSITGIVDTVTRASTKGGAPYFKIKMVGRRSEDTDMEFLYLSLWSSALVGTGQLIDLFGADGYDRRVSTAHHGAVTVTNVGIAPNGNFKISTSNDTEIQRAQQFDAAQATLVQVASFANNDLATLAELAARPWGQQCNVLLAAPYATEVRPFKTRAGRTMPVRHLSFIDASKDQNGNYCTGSILAFNDNPVLRPVLEAGVEQKPAFNSDASTGGIYKVEDPARVVIFMAMGVTMQAPSQAGQKSYASFREARYRVVYPTDGDERAEALRTWYKDTGHLHFVPHVRLPDDFSSNQAAYDELEASLPKMSSSSSSSSAAAAAADDCW